MPIAMNRFQIVKARKTPSKSGAAGLLLKDVEGFVEFHLLRGPEADDHTLFASHTIWRDRDAFEAWTRSDHFRRAHPMRVTTAPCILVIRSSKGLRRFWKSKMPMRPQVLVALTRGR